VTRMSRCPWVEHGSADEITYHDEEWGVPVHDDRLLFELLTLEGAQSGLRWSTILARRGGYRRVFSNFDPPTVATWPDTRADEFILDTGVIRHKGKLLSVLNNARAIMRLLPEFPTFDSYLWTFTDGRQLQPQFSEICEIPAHPDVSERLSHDMKRRGFRFVGPTTVYALMQAAGLTNDHILECFRHADLDSVQLNSVLTNTEGMTQDGQ
jgi:DNA-3-methyladenine glycosylase I